MMGAYKRYILFGYEGRYPDGGLQDVKGSFDSIEEAIAYIKKEKFYETYEILDRIEGIEIEEIEERVFEEMEKHGTMDIKATLENYISQIQPELREKGGDIFLGKEEWDAYIKFVYGEYWVEAPNGEGKYYYRGFRIRKG